MSLNTAHANGGVLIFNGEMILLYCNGVDLQFEGNCAKTFGGSKKGRIYLTTHRMIFVNKSESDPLRSFSFPFFSLSAMELEQPVFGANFIKGAVTAQAQGNWTGRATFKLKFSTGGAIEFGQAMVKTAQMARQYMPAAPPPYFPMEGPFFQPPPPAYMAPQGGVAGFVPPTHAFPDQPPAYDVYMAQAPPPYPGISPNLAPMYPNYPMPPAPTTEQISGYPQGAPLPPGFVGQNGGPVHPPPPYSQGATAPPAPGPQGQFQGFSQQGADAPNTKSGCPEVGLAWQLGDTNRFFVPQNQNINGNPYVYYPNDAPPPYAPDKKDQ